MQLFPAQPELEASGALRVAVYTYATRKLFKCKACNHQFSVTSGTIFASRKLSIRDYLLAIAIFVNGAKGHSALQLSRDLDCQYKTAFVRAAIGQFPKACTVPAPDRSGQPRFPSGPAVRPRPALS